VGEVDKAVKETEAAAVEVAQEDQVAAVEVHLVCVAHGRSGDLAMQEARV
jgi:hypothetical protein